MPAKKRITKDMILDAALSLLKKHGLDAVNIKALAGELHCFAADLSVIYGNG